MTFSGRKCSFCWRRIQRSRVEVGGVELPVARRRALGIDEPLALEEADLRDRDVGELVAQLGQHLADRQVRRLAALIGGLTGRSRRRNTRTKRPIWRSAQVVQRRGVDALVVDVGAVERPDVAHLVARRRPGAIDGVAARHGDVVEEDVGVGVAAERGDLAVEHEAAAGVGPAPHHEHAHALGQLGQGLAELLVELQALGELGEAQGGFVLVGQRAPARGAEVRPGLVLVAALAASHGRNGTPADPIGVTVTLDVRSTLPLARGQASGSTEVDGEVEGEVEGRGESLDQRVEPRCGGRSARRAPPCVTVAARSCSRVTAGAPGRAGAGRSRRTASRSSRIEPCWRTAPRRRTCAEPQSLRSPTRRSAPCWPAKHTGPAGPSWRAMAASTPSRRQPRDERAAPAPCRRRRRRPAAPAGRGIDDGVREVGAVQEPLSPGRPAHHVDAPAVARVAVDVVVGLEVPERERRRRPAVEPQRGRCAVGDRVEQRRVGLHLRRRHRARRRGRRPGASSS